MASQIPLFDVSPLSEMVGWRVLAAPKSPQGNALRSLLQLACRARLADCKFTSVLRARSVLLCRKVRLRS